MTLPPFNETGLLPQGEWSADWKEITERFGFNLHRRDLCDSLHQALHVLKQAGCTTVWINGSFVTDKHHPGDVDVLYRTQGVQPRRLPPDFRDRAACKATYRGDYLPVDDTAHNPNRPEDLFKFFTQTRQGESKGIIRLSLSNLPAPPTHHDQK